MTKILLAIYNFLSEIFNCHVNSFNLWQLSYSNFFNIFSLPKSYKKIHLKILLLENFK